MPVCGGAASLVVARQGLSVYHWTPPQRGVTAVTVRADEEAKRRFGGQRKVVRGGGGFAAEPEIVGISPCRLRWGCLELTGVACMLLMCGAQRLEFCLLTAEPCLF